MINAIPPLRKVDSCVNCGKQYEASYTTPGASIVAWPSYEVPRVNPANGKVEIFVRTACTDCAEKRLMNDDVRRLIDAEAAALSKP